MALLNTAPDWLMMVYLEIVAMGASRQLFRGCVEIAYSQAREGALP